MTPWTVFIHIWNSTLNVLINNMAILCASMSLERVVWVKTMKRCSKNNRFSVNFLCIKKKQWKRKVCEIILKPKLFQQNRIFNFYELLFNKQFVVNYLNELDSKIYLLSKRSFCGFEHYYNTENRSNFVFWSTTHNKWWSNKKKT